VRLANTSLAFTTTADTTAPTVTATNPTAGATGIARGVAPRFDSNERLVGVTTGTYEIRNNATNAVVPATVTSNAAGTRWTLTPSVNLAAATTYRVTLTGGATGIRDAAGNPLTGNTGVGSTTFTWTFTTR
jgi:type 1 fimbria pilin